MSSPAVCFGSPSPEHDISVLTGLQAVHALNDAGHPVIALYWSKAGDWYQVPADVEAADFADGVPRSATPVLLLTGGDGGFVAEGRRARRTRLEISGIVNCCHGVPGEDGTLQAMFDLAGLRYTGPSQWGAAIGMDKLAFTGTMAGAGVPCLDLWLLTEDLEIDTSGPLIVKPRFGGSSIGIEVVDDLATAKALARTQPLLREGAVVQRFVDDAVDLNISVRTWPELSFSAIERPVRTRGTHIYSYAEKYLGGTEGMASAPRELPAVLPANIETKLVSMAASVADLAMVRSVARIDFLWAGEDLWVNEINTIPGSLSWYFWAERGVPFLQLLDDMLDEASRGPTRRFRTDGADGTALKSVGAIAGKLA